MRIYLIFTLLITTLAGFAQNTGQITGKLSDSADKRVLALSTVTVFIAADTTVVTYRLSDNDGNFKVPGLPLNTPLRIIISNISYSVFRQEFTLTAASPKLDLGNISMSRSSRELDEALVIAERPPVTVRHDTIEFNASSFKTLPTALVEDLLRKMPGVQVDKQGNIFYNGRPVNRITVDGKSFFGDDPKMASRNLPANIIDKVQVTDDKDQLLALGEENANQVGKVINLRLKKGVKRGWFGKAYAGGGTGQRYEAGGIANTFRDTLQLSLLGYTNNINNSGFSIGDIQSLGGFDRSGSNTISMMKNNGGSKISVNDIAFGGANEGVAASSGAGFNLNHAPTKNTSLFLQYFYGHVNNKFNRESYTDQFFADTVIGSNYNTNKATISSGHNVNMGMRLRPNTFTNINLRIGFSAGREREDIFSRLESVSNKTGLLSTALSDFDNVHKSDRITHNLNINSQSRSKKGRQINLNQTSEISRRDKERISKSVNSFFQPAPGGFLQDQLREEEAPDTKLNTAVTYREPLAKKITLSVSGRHEFSKLKNAVGTFLANGTGGYTIPDNSQSNVFERLQNRYSLSTGLILRIKKISITPGFTLLRQVIDNKVDKTGAVLEQRFFNLLPRLDFSKGNLNLNYSANAEAPGYEHLLPVADNSNPFYVKNGNTGLVPAIRHSIGVNYFLFNTKTGVNVNLFLNGSLTKNAVVESRQINSNGAQIITPVNANGNRNMRMNLIVSKERKYSGKVKVSFGGSANLNYNRGRLIVNGNGTYQQTVNLQTYFNVELNYDDVVELRQTVGPGFFITRFTAPEFSPQDVTMVYTMTDLIVRWPWKLIWETNLNIDYNGQIAAGLPRTVYLMNAAVNVPVLKNDKGILRLSVFDALNTNSNIERSANANSVFNSRTEVLQRYLMLTFTYNLRTVGGGKSKTGSRDRFMLF